MLHYVVKGGTPLCGEVEIGGAKNAALAIVAASIMADEPVTIENVPDVSDIRAITGAIAEIGGVVEHPDPHTYVINGAFIKDEPVDTEAVRKIRGSYYLIGALLGKYKKAEVALPGGCNIGLRPIDQHIKGFRALGADVRVASPGMVVAKADELLGSHIYMDVVSVGATINVVMAAALARGNTIIENAATAPHVVDLANFLNSMGARIKGDGTDVILIKGVYKLHGTTYSIIPDQIEAGTYMYAAAATHGDVTITNVIPKHLESLTAKLLEIGCEIIESDDSVRVVAKRRLDHTLRTCSLRSAFFLVSNGTSIVTESIFENRFKYVDELTKMGASIRVEGNTAIIDGVASYSGANLNAPDLRAGAALVAAALAANGYSEIYDIHYIERGYERFPEKLRALGACIAKVDSADEERRAVNEFNLRIVG